MAGACQDENASVRDAAARALSMYIELIYFMLPDLTPSQLEKIPSFSAGKGLKESVATP